MTEAGIITTEDANPKTLIGADKVNLSLVPPAAKIHLATAMMDGAKKYGAYNWREKKVPMMTYIAAAQRHLDQLLDGEDYDPVSLVHHAGHMMACGAIILDAMETQNLIDDRPKRGAASGMIRDFKPDTKLSK
jgi:hypothetical protein